MSLRSNRSYRKTHETPPEMFPEQFDPSRHVYSKYLGRKEWRDAVNENREEIKKAAQDGKTALQFPTGETAMKIEQEAARKKISAIKDQGLDLPAYNRIDAQVQVDPELRKEIEQINGTRAK